MIPFASKIKSATANNDHGAAIKYGIESLTLEPETRDSLLDKLDRVQRQHKKTGYLTPELNQERRQIYEEMLRAAKKQFSKEEYERFYFMF